jgi:hypothetical protein
MVSWDISNNVWEKLGKSSTCAVASYGAVSMSMDNRNNYLWIVGTFATVTDASGTLTVNGCAYWNFNNNRWYPLGTTTYNGITNYNTSIGYIVGELDSSNNMYYIFAGNNGSGGISCYDASYTSTPLRASWIVAYNITSSRWNLLGTNPSNDTTSTTNGLNSFNIHLKQCQELWIAREELKPKNERKPVPLDPTVSLLNANLHSPSKEDYTKQTEIY